MVAVSAPVFQSECTARQCNDVACRRAGHCDPRGSRHRKSDAAPDRCWFHARRDV